MSDDNKSRSFGDILRAWLLPMKWRDRLRFSNHTYYEQVFFVVSAFATLVAIFYIFICRVISDQMETQNRFILESAYHQVGSHMNDLETVLLNITHDVEFFINHDYPAKEVQKYLRTAAEEFKERKGFFYSELECAGLFGELFGKQMDGTVWDVPDTYFVQQQEWYVGAKESNGKLYYSLPYYPIFSKVLTLTLSRSVFKTKENGTKEFAGVFGINIELDNMAKLVGLIQHSPHGYAVLIDSRKNVIAHYNNYWIGKPVDIVSEGGIYIAENLNRARCKEVLSSTSLNSEKIPCIYYFSVLRNGWTVVSIMPVSEFYRQCHFMGLILSAVAAIMAVILCIFLTRLYREKNQADKRNQSKSSFLAKMSHEIRTPMNVITGLSRLIVQEKNLLPPKILKYALEIRHAGENLLAIINDILDLTKIESGRLEFTDVKFTLSSLLEDVITIMRSRIYEKGLQFITHIDCRLPNALIGDIVHIRQILLNILGNAAKYTREGYVAFEVLGTISEKGSVLFTFIIRDTGIGVKEEDKSRIFSDFVQADSAMNWNIEGTGLGLPIARELVHRIGGTISMISQYNFGTTFTVNMPIKYEDELPFASVQNVEAHNVLIFEPRPLYEQSLIRTLGQFGVKYRRAANVSVFNEQLQNNKFTFVFIASFAYEDVSKILETPFLAGTQAVLLCESVEQIRMARTRSVMLPVNAGNIADLLNNTYRSEEDSGVRSYFKIPSARILVVDDNRPNLLVAEGLLAPYECQIDFATSGHEAIRFCKLYQYDLIFMDHMMPEMDGIEATLKIRSLPCTTKEDKYFQEVPIIALTANAVFGMKDVFLQHGMNDFLPKPIDPSKLGEILETWISADKCQAVPVSDWESSGKKNESTILIPGVNTRIGIIQTGGTLEGYVQVVSTMCKEMESKIEAIQKALAADNLALYKTYVHSYKSMLATVGVMPLSVTAAMLEIAAQNEDRPTIESHHEPFIRDLRETGAAILNVLDRTGHNNKGKNELTEEDKEFLKSGLTELKAAIAELKMKQIDMVMDGLLGRRWTKEISDRLDKVMQHIMLFEWKEAAEQVSQLESLEPQP